MTSRPWYLLGLPLLLVASGAMQSILAEDSKKAEPVPDEGRQEDMDKEDVPKQDLEPKERQPEEPRAAEGSLPHDGVAAKSREFTYEIAFHTYGIEVYISDLQGQPVPTKGVAGTVEMAFGEPGRVRESAGLAPILARETGAPEGLGADLALDHVAQGEASAVIRLTGLPGQSEREAEIEAGFRLARIVQLVCPTCYFSPRSGNMCPGCKIPLVEQRSLFVCPVHVEVASDRPGSRCWRCAGQALKPNVERAPSSVQGIQ